MKKKLIIKKYYTAWCGPCKTLTNIIKPILEKYKDDIEFEEIDCEEVDVTDMGIRAVPTVVLFNQDAEISRKTGLISANEFEQLILKYK